MFPLLMVLLSCFGSFWVWGKIDLLVNKLEYKDYNIDPQSLDYPLYLGPLSLSYH